MPKSTSTGDAPFFDEIALAYGENVRELKAAEQQFERQCRKALEALMPILASALRKATLTVPSTLPEAKPWKGCGWYGTFHLAGEYSKRREKTDCSGLSLGFAYGEFFDRDYIDFGFYPYLWFYAARKPEGERLRSSIKTDLAAACPHANRVRGMDSEIYLLLPPPPKLLTLDGARSSLDALVEDYPTADRWMANSIVATTG